MISMEGTHAHLTREQVEAYNRRRLTPGELITFDEHLDLCRMCRQLVHSSATAMTSDVSEAWHALLHNDGQSDLEHLAYEQLAAYTDSKVNAYERAMAESHLAICEQCAREASALNATRGALATYFDTAADSSFDKVATNHQPLDVAGVTFKDKLAVWWKQQQNWLPTRVAWPAFAAGLAVLLLAVAVWQVRQIFSPKPAAQVDRAARQVINKDNSSTVSTENTNATADSNRQSVLQDTSQSESASADASHTSIIDKSGEPLRDEAGLITLDSQQRLRGLETMPQPVQERVRRVLAGERLSIPAAKELHEGSVKLMGTQPPANAPEATATFQPLNPVNVAVLETRPVFRWRAVAGASSYEIRIFDRNYKQVAGAVGLSATQWQTPQPLARGRVYLWQVVALANGEEINSQALRAPEARFSIISQQQATQIARARNLPRTSHLALGVLYAEAGLLEDAKKEFQVLLRRNPQSSVARRLLRELSAAQAQ